MFCKHCGGKNEDGSKFCIKCGKEIATGSVAQTAAIEASEEKQPLKGLGGWLILVCLGLIASVLVNIAGSFSEFSTLSSSNLDGYPSLQNAILFEAVIIVAFAIFGIYLIYIFAKKKKIFPKLYIIFLVGAAVWGVVDYSLTSSIFSSYPQLQSLAQSTLSDLSGNLGRDFIAALIWISYMKKSKRVKLTFTE